MKSRLLAGVAAVILALVGVMMLYGYAQGAETRAVQGLDPISVLVVATEVPAGTPSEELMPFLTTESLPATAIGASALKDLDSSAGKVTAVDLVPGEQLLAERLIDPPDATASVSVEVPKGLQEVSFALEPARAVGGKLTPGDTVGIFISMAPGALPNEPDAQTTQLVFHKVLVTSVQRAPSASPVDPAATPEEQARAEAEALPGDSLMLTVAVSEEQATAIVFGNEFEKIWLSKEPASAAESPAPITIHDKVLYR
ncbi:Flp pilus assembly protein CpaB [Arthrobacter sedimenti]|uniref:Flp pilus assembly protein CpaB n=1 Tax=Arthrobacter sedimenti TaxID=2694931 RepID=UPI000B3503B7|nr:RcpC/CpaB family pilus assembly protein [Arthrobacter sedimenti]OUM40045.1 flagellar biosynthesis protein FlgA [Arthrobacter agilis]